MGDGESAEGSIWEAAAFAGHYKLDNLVGIIDVNRYVTKYGMLLYKVFVTIQLYMSHSQNQWFGNEGR